MGFFSEAKTVEQLEEENERQTQQLSIAEKRAAIALAKKKYGSHFKLHMPKIESGFDWSALKFRVK